MQAKATLAQLLEMRNLTRSMFLGKLDITDFGECSPIYIAQKIDSFIVELESLKVRVFYHARHNKKRSSGQPENDSQDPS